MTESTTTTTEVREQERPRCDFGSKSKHPCWREATQRMFAEHPEPQVCEEHFRAIELGRKVDSYLDALYKLREWIASEVDGEYENRLTNHAYTMRDNLEREYWQVAIKDRAAEIIANAGPGEAEHISLEAAEEFAEVSLRDDALSNARGILEDAPETLFGTNNRWEIVAGLVAALKPVHEEHEKIKQRIGLK
jgi:hypothetical protein